MSETTTLPGPRAPGLRRRASAPAEPSTNDAPRSAPTRRRGAAGRLFLGSPGDPSWVRPLLWVLVLGTATLYLVDITNSGTANSFYAAAVKSGTESLEAWLFGSLDAANAITVDKPPAALWVMVLSARIFGFSSASMLVPQALMGVGTVALTYAGVKRWFTPAAGLIAGALIALTPVAALMFRFNNPDAFLVFTMTLAAYAVIRAVDTPARAVRWLVLAGTALGFAFLTKLLQGLLVLPAFGLVYLIASANPLRKRLLHLLAAAGALVVSAGWFVVLVELWPSAARPYIGGSTNNSLWELALGYNGLSRILGTSGGPGGSGAGGGFGGQSGPFRLFNSSFAGEIAWLLPAALIALVVGFVLAGRARRTDRLRAGMILWGGWLVVTAVVFSFMSGIVHPYYAVALAPAIGAVIGIVATRLWQRREQGAARGTLASMIAVTAIWGCYAMGTYASGWMSWVRWTMLVGGVLGAAVLAMSGGAFRRIAVAAALIGSLASLGGTAAYTVATVAGAHTGSIPSSGPASVNSGGFARAGVGGPGAQLPGAIAGGTAQGSAQPDSGDDASELTGLLNATTTRWSAAVIGSQSAASYILSTDTAVMAIGGWSGSDNSPTLEEFQTDVANGQITYFIAGGDGRGGPGGGSGASSSSEITAWVEAHFAATTVGGVTVYDLTATS
ncbi:MAG TPA: glycosyltransferase family 39 protein [Microlunatus sp.]|nr:glycosyltransferase family 39 protein [Microlunatus sp.]